jgi:hypothetical protein
MMPVQGTRGMTQTLKGNKNALVVETHFNYTVVPKNITEDILSYPKPDNMNEFIEAIRDTVQQEGGSFSGDENTGTFEMGDFEGDYSISGDSIVIRLKHPIEESIAGNSKTRSIAKAFSFSFQAPADLTQAVTTVRTGITKKGGTFFGDEREGNFKASGITGNYAIDGGTANVLISEKPGILSNSLIEKEVKKFFGVR